MMDKSHSVTKESNLIPNNERHNERVDISKTQGNIKREKSSVKKNELIKIPIQ